MLLVVSSSEGMNVLRKTSSIFSTLQENVRAICVVLDGVEIFTIPLHAASPIVLKWLRPCSTVRIRVDETREARDPCAVRCTVVRHRKR